MERTVTDTDKRDTDKILKIFEGSVTLYNRRSRERVTLYRPAKKKEPKRNKAVHPQDSERVWELEAADELKSQRKHQD